jgi:hypothetical protein
VPVVVFPILLHGRETWSVALKEEYKFRVCEKKVLSRVFEPKEEEVTE